MTEAEQPEALDERMKFEAAMIALAAEISGNDGAPLIFARDRNGYTNGAMEIGWRLFQAGRASIKAEGTEQKRPRQCLHGISEPSGWRDIETAPKDGTAVLVYPSTWDDRTCSTASWESDRYAKKPRPYWRRDDDLGRVTHSREALTTHWMPMPLPPSPSSADEGGSK